MQRREGGEGEQVLTGLFEQLGRLRKACPEFLDDRGVLTARGRRIRLGEDRAHERSDQGLRRAGHPGQQVIRLPAFAPGSDLRRVRSARVPEGRPILALEEAVVVAVARVDGSHRLVGDGPLVEFSNRWLGHLEARRFAPTTVRAYAFDLLCLARFFDDAGIDWREATPTDFFDWLEWQSRPTSTIGQRVVSLVGRRTPTAATMNRRIAAARGLYEHAVVCGILERDPVPAPRRSSELRAPRRGLLGHLHGRRAGAPVRLVRQERRLPESLDAHDVAVFLADFGTHRDRAIVLLMLLGGLRSAEVRSLRLADVDVGIRQVKVTGKGAKQRVVPVDRAFFAELTAYLQTERPWGLSTPECFVVMRGPTAGRGVSEAGLRRIFRTHRARSGASRVRPHRAPAHLRHRARVRGTGG